MLHFPNCHETWNEKIFRSLYQIYPNAKHNNKADHEILRTLGECANLLYVRVWIRIKPFVFVWLLEHGHQAGGRGLGRNYHHLLCRYWPHLHSFNNLCVPNRDFLRWVKLNICKTLISAVYLWRIEISSRELQLNFRTEKHLLVARYFSNIMTLSCQNFVIWLYRIHGSFNTL